MARARSWIFAQVAAPYEIQDETKISFWLRAVRFIIKPKENVKAICAINIFPRGKERGGFRCVGQV